MIARIASSVIGSESGTQRDDCNGARIEDELEQEALFELQGPDEDSCVWACSPEGRDVWCQNLGPVDKVAEVMSQWLASIDADENF